MKRSLAMALTLVFTLIFVACGNKGDVLDLTGGWEQSNSNSGTSRQIAMIDGGTIEIRWQDEDGSSYLYWAGTYQAPTSETNEFTWVSVNDKSRTGSALLASGDDTKTFTHKNGAISYSVSVMGVTTTVKIERSTNVNFPVIQAITATDLLPLELVESGFALVDRYDGYYIQYAFALKNPNAERAVEFPTVRITAWDVDGAVLGTDEIVDSFILPGGTLYSASLGPTVDTKPDRVEFQVVQPNITNWVTSKELDNAGDSLQIENPTKRNDKITGVVLNPNKFDIDSVAVVVVFRDKDGKLLAGNTTYIDAVPADGKAPFELSFYGNKSFVSDDFEVYAYPR